MLDRAPSNAMLLGSTLGRLAIACGARAPAGSAARRHAAAEARHHARDLSRSPTPADAPRSACSPPAPPSSTAIVDGAIAELRRTLPLLDAIDPDLFAPPARRRLGQLVGGDEGAALVAAADAALAREGVARPALAAMIAPGAG